MSVLHPGTISVCSFVFLSSYECIKLHYVRPVFQVADIPATIEKKVIRSLPVINVPIDKEGDQSLKNQAAIEREKKQEAGSSKGWHPCLDICSAKCRSMNVSVTL